MCIRDSSYPWPAIREQWLFVVTTPVDLVDVLFFRAVRAIDNHDAMSREMLRATGSWLMTHDAAPGCTC
eukprot:1150529-Alexandrium_andersonii.AAC.1